MILDTTRYHYTNVLFSQKKNEHCRTLGGVKRTLQVSCGFQSEHYPQRYYHYWFQQSYRLSSWVKGEARVLPPVAVMLSMYY